MSKTNNDELPIHTRVCDERIEELEAENAILRAHEDDLNHALKLADAEIDGLHEVATEFKTALLYCGRERDRAVAALEEIQATDNFLEIWDIAKSTLKQEKQNDY